MSRGIIAKEALAELEREVIESQSDFGELLLQKEIITDTDLLKLKGEIYKLPIIDISGLEIDQQVSKRISDSAVNFYKIIPFAEENGVLRVALLNPENIDALQALKFIASDQEISFEKYLISYQDFHNLYRSFRSLTTEVGKALESISEDIAEKELKVTGKEAKLEEITAEAPVSKIVATVIKHAAESRASDIHIEPVGNRLRLRLRIDGEMKTALYLPGSLRSALVTRIKILSDLKIDETRLAQDGRFSTTVANRKIDFRVSTLPTINGEKAVLRILDPLSGYVELEQLGLEGRSLNLILENIAKPFGALLMTGPTGSGKSTTLSAILRKMNSEAVNIVTLEDPVEYFIDGVNQSQTHEEIGYTFATGLRHILRQDPDVIMVGEIRDPETAGLATQAALTGHVVLSTLHTNNTIGVIPRLIDMGVEKYLIAPSLNLAAAQRLVRRLCNECKLKKKATPSEERIIKQALQDIPAENKKDVPSDSFEMSKTGKGCKGCDGTGYRGRVAIFEALAMTDELEKIILTDLSEENLKREAERQGMITMFQDGIIKVIQGITSIEEVIHVAEDTETKKDQKPEADWND